VVVEGDLFRNREGGEERSHHIGQFINRATRAAVVPVGSPLVPLPPPIKVLVRVGEASNRQCGVVSYAKYAGGRIQSQGKPVG
jgi:hypothetical protein